MEGLAMNWKRPDDFFVSFVVQSACGMVRERNGIECACALQDEWEYSSNGSTGSRPSSGSRPGSGSRSGSRGRNNQFQGSAKVPTPVRVCVKGTVKSVCRLANIFPKQAESWVSSWKTSDGFAARCALLSWSWTYWFIWGRVHVQVVSRWTLPLFRTLEREQRWLLGHSGDRHLGGQHNGLTRVSALVLQAHTRLILQHPVSCDRSRNWQFAASVFLSWLVFPGDFNVCVKSDPVAVTPHISPPQLFHWAPCIPSQISIFICLTHTNPSMKGGEVAMVTASQQL